MYLLTNYTIQTSELNFCLILKFDVYILSKNPERSRLDLNLLGVTNSGCTRALSTSCRESLKATSDFLSRCLSNILCECDHDRIWRPKVSGCRGASVCHVGHSGSAESRGFGLRASKMAQQPLIDLTRHASSCSKADCLAAPEGSYRFRAACSIYDCGYPLPGTSSGLEFAIWMKRRL